MEQVTTENLSVKQAANTNYTCVLFNGPLSNEQFKDALKNKTLQASLKEKKVTNLLLDCSRLGIFSIPDMSDYLDIDFMSTMERSHIKKVAVIVDEQVLYMMQFVFQQIELNHANSNALIRFFNPAQLNQSAEAVAWFN